MKRLLSLVLAAGLSAAAAATMLAQPAPQPVPPENQPPQTQGAAAKSTVQVRGLSVLAEVTEETEQLRPFNSFARTAIVLLANMPEGGMISFKADESSVETFADSTGANLAPDNGNIFSEFRTQFSKDRKNAIIQMESDKSPAKGAKNIVIKGKLVFMQATETNTYMQANVALKEGVEFKLGPLEFKIVKAGKPDWGNDPLELGLESSQPAELLKGLRIKDADGKIVRYNEGGYSRTYGPNNEPITTTNFRLTKNIETATLEADVWGDAKAVELPFEATITLGF